VIAAVSMVRDEDDIVGATVARMLDQVDRVIVADNGSTDETPEILAELAHISGRLTVVEDTERGYYQAQKMTGLAQRAREMGAEWVIPFDADEVWVARRSTLADRLRSLPDDALVCEATLFDHVPTAKDPEGSPVERITWRRRAAAPLRKVAVRAREDMSIAQGNHSASFAGVEVPLRVAELLEVRHFPYRSAEQMIRKARNGAQAYAATDLPEAVGAHWRQYGRTIEEEGEDALAAHFYRWFYSADPEADTDLIRDPCPL